jgi:hypothetical protein
MNHRCANQLPNSIIRIRNFQKRGAGERVGREGQVEKQQPEVVAAAEEGRHLFTM